MNEEQDCCGTHMQRVIMTGGIPVGTNPVAIEKCDQQNAIYFDKQNGTVALKCNSNEPSELRFHA